MVVTLRMFGTGYTAAEAAANQRRGRVLFIGTVISKFISLFTGDGALNWLQTEDLFCSS